jgi:hypothetical protein
LNSQLIKKRYNNHNNYNNYNNHEKNTLEELSTLGECGEELQGENAQKAVITVYIWIISVVVWLITNDVPYHIQLVLVL